MEEGKDILDPLLLSIEHQVHSDMVDTRMFTDLRKQRQE